MRTCSSLFIFNRVDINYPLLGHICMYDQALFYLFSLFAIRIHTAGIFRKVLIQYAGTCTCTLQLLNIRQGYFSISILRVMNDEAVCFLISLYIFSIFVCLLSFLILRDHIDVANHTGQLVLSVPQLIIYGTGQPVAIGYSSYSAVVCAGLLVRSDRSVQVPADRMQKYKCSYALYYCRTVLQYSATVL